MKILHVDLQRGWRGGEQQLLYLAEGLKGKGIKVCVASVKGEELFKRCREKGIDTLPLKGNRSSDILRLGYWGKGFDLIHAHCSKSHLVAALSKRFHKKPLIYTRRVDYFPKKDPITSLKYRLTDRLVAISEAVKEVLKEAFKGVKVYVIPSAVNLRELERSLDPKKVREVKEEFKGKPLIGSLAALTEQKDIPNLIRASKLVKGRLKTAEFVVFGEGKLKDKLLKLIEEEGVKDFFKLYGFVKDVANYTKALDIFVLPSKNEGLGSSILIAMALKVPVIATDVGGVREAVIDGKTGILVPPSNPKALGEAILKLATEKELKESLTEEAYKLVLEKFSVESMVNSYIEVYKEVLK
ncbi:glycosyltransferase family 4 protein [Thermovibrio sp.]